MSSRVLRPSRRRVIADGGVVKKKTTLLVKFND